MIDALLSAQEIAEYNDEQSNKKPLDDEARKYDVDAAYLDKMTEDKRSSEDGEETKKTDIQPKYEQELKTTQEELDQLQQKFTDIQSNLFFYRSVVQDQNFEQYMRNAGFYTQIESLQLNEVQYGGDIFKQMIKNSSDFLGNQEATEDDKLENLNKIIPNLESQFLTILTEMQTAQEAARLVSSQILRDMSNIDYQLNPEDRYQQTNALEEHQRTADTLIYHLDQNRKLIDECDLMLKAIATKISSLK